MTFLSMIMLTKNCYCCNGELFSQLQFSNETALPPDALRRALAESFFDQQRFQLGFMDDAAECFENMLLRIHMHIAHGEAEDMCNARHCIPHQKFAMTLVEQSVCNSCGATSEPLSYTQMVHYVSTSTLVYQVRTTRPQGVIEPFGQLLRKAGSMGDIRVCPSACGAVIQIGRTLMNRPEIVSVGLVWNSERPTLEHIMEVFSTIGTTLRLSEVFNTVVDSRWAESCVHNLVGVVTYYGKHYSTFFFHTKLRVWIYFDDATVREVGPRWDQVVEKCRKGRYQPLLLLYALPDGTPVNTENAPKQVIPFYSDKPVNKKPPASSQSILRRSVTPSPEKPNIGNNTRRAITPNPDGTANQKPPLPRSYNEYQNLSVIQSNLYNNQPRDVVDGDMSRKDPEYVTRKSLDGQKQLNIHRTLSNGSSSGTEGISFRDYLNVPRTRDSGNWSSDRNSASSSSSTTMENPYLYLLGKVPHENNNVPTGHLPPRNESSSSSSSGVYDVGYDSYSLSSNDSSTMTTIQHLMKMGHLAKIPEDYNSTPAQISQSCDVLCDEADELLVKSRQLEDDHDLVLALALCNAAATKARAAMDAPYNNPQTLTLARMKHNTCIMRARSLHRRMTQNSQNLQGKDVAPEIRHTREGSSGSGKHSRQSSRDKGQHSRQNSKELLCQPTQEKQTSKNIEIYATLPKKKDGLKKIAVNIDEDDDYVLYDKPPGRESRSIFSRSKNKESQKMREKRSRSEDRNKMSRDFSIAPEIISGKDTLKREKAKEDKEEKKDKDGKSKKQHKIRRKLLMGGLIKRKNRSMPDLTDTNADKERTVEKPNSTVDDSSVGLKGAVETASSMCGYLSEGHLEFTGNSTNPNLERSKLMRKSFHGSAGKILTAAKVPPPPPLRTTSQLSTSKLNGGEVFEDKGERPKYPLPTEALDPQYYQYYDGMSNYGHAPVSLPYMATQHHNNNYINQYADHNKEQVMFHTPNSNMVVTRADVHQEQEATAPNQIDNGVDEVDCLPSHNSQNLELPPYPSPLGSAIHSRQASEEFPPPPPPLDLSALDEHLKEPSPPPTPSPVSLLSQLQNKRQEILSQESEIRANPEPVRSSGDTWLKELQAKQAALRMKKNQCSNDPNGGVDVVSQKYSSGESEAAKATSVKDLATKFESIQVQPLEVNNVMTNANVARSVNLGTAYSQQNYLNKFDSVGQNGVVTARKREELDAIVPEQVEEVQSGEDSAKKNKLGKKKSVSFCDQVILVATAEEQEDDSYIPNPILERVLRSAMNKPETAAIRQEVLALRQAEVSQQLPEILDCSQSNNEEKQYVQHPLYVRRNSVDNLLSKQNFSEPECGYVSGYDRQLYGTSPQHGGQTLYRQSPYQRIPQNSPVYMYNNPPINKPVGSPNYPNALPPNQQYKVPNGYSYPQEYNPTLRTAYTQQVPQMRQSPIPLQHNYPTQHPIYQHPPSPAPSNVSSNYNYQQNLYGRQHTNTYDTRMQYNQRMATPPDPNMAYRKSPPPPECDPQVAPTYSPYQPVPSHYYQETNANPSYQRVPPPHMEQEMLNYQQTPKYPPYQLPPKQLLKKTVSFEPGTKGGTESPTPKAVVTPIIVNNANNSVPTGKTKCNLCRKKVVVSSNLYCTDCEFYMSRFKPKR
ncbi:uncharacterized protein BDFB_009540 [Asbolus verrucosus]|uniref:USP domain-containing protein n=1 Tax=Asbolus verrucosus TaxID=1661398 RepID=A0A482VPD0_ASBVE|nr:uncharacterized protein BDFB_009540 [Asbolus verrucosus]